MKSPSRLVIIALFVVLGLLLPRQGHSEDKGEIKLPLDQYVRLISMGSDSAARDHYTLGQAKALIAVRETDDKRLMAEVDVTIPVEVQEARWTAVSILPLGTVITSASVNGGEVSLSPTKDSIAWMTNRQGATTLSVSYQVEAARSDGSVSLIIPLPRSLSTQVTASVPAGESVSAAPIAGLKRTAQNGMTLLSGTVMGAPALQITWGTAARSGFTISRASYEGTTAKDSTSWDATFFVDSFEPGVLKIPLFSNSLTLTEVRVDGKESPVLVMDGRFLTTVEGKGTHKVSASFELPIERAGGPAKVTLPLVEVPISKVQLTLAGKKELSVEPGQRVQHRIEGDNTVATAYVSLGSVAALTWMDAVPEEDVEELRATAQVYHLLSAEEGLLTGDATIDYEITRGGTSLLEFLIPRGIEIDRVTSPQGGIVDWKRENTPDTATDLLQVFLNYEARSPVRVRIGYERTLVGQNDPFRAPLIRCKGVTRQRGMLSLLSSRDLSLKPLNDETFTRVGENQLPADIRELTKLTIAHTYKYLEEPPPLDIQTGTPDRKEGRFDSSIHTLVSLGDVSLRAAASIEVSVKSGAIQELSFMIPHGVNILNLTAPSLRNFTVNPGDPADTLAVNFTQEMEGQFRIEVSYEKLMDSNSPQVDVPTLTAPSSDVEQGKLGVEAVSAVEVEPKSAQSMSSIDPGELPQQLVLRTTNPILMAYKYIRTSPPAALSLKVTRHRTLEMERASIESAAYRTLYTKDGKAVTHASFIVRNTQSQFLKLQLPPETRVLAATVNGAPEKPAFEEGGKGGILVKIISAAQGFPVELLFQTPVGEVESIFGKATVTLPRPELVVANTTWDLFLPNGLEYGAIDTNLEALAVDPNVPVPLVRASGVDFMQSVQFLGHRLSFRKLYGSPDDSAPFASVTYASGMGKIASGGFSGIATLLVWIGLFVLTGRIRAIRAVGLGALLAGTVGLALLVLLYGVSFKIPLWISAVVVLGGVFPVLRGRRTAAPVP